MSYAVEWSDEALADLSALSVPLQGLVESEIERLRRDPVSLSKPATFPYWQVQCYEIRQNLDDRRYLITILFQYGADESTLHLLAIAVMSW